jgi:REP element-mobilizing transposase RayT
MFAMLPQPLYLADAVQPAFELRYSWTGWPASPPFLADPSVLDEIACLWEDDSLRLLDRFWSDEKVHLTFSAKPEVSPVFFASRVKGRLDHGLRRAAQGFGGFSRKVSVCSVGHNCREQVEAYIASQVETARFADPSFQELMAEFTVVDSTVDLSLLVASAHGRYWYNLHLVLVTTERYRVVDRTRLTTIRDRSFAIARKKGYRISRLSVMPDHLHMALGGDIEQSPQEIALAFQNNLAYALGQSRIWTDTYYAGTFGEYDMWAIRGKASPR